MHRRQDETRCSSAGMHTDQRTPPSSRRRASRDLHVRTQRQGVFGMTSDTGELSQCQDPEGHRSRSGPLGSSIWRPAATQRRTSRSTCVQSHLAQTATRLSCVDHVDRHCMGCCGGNSTGASITTPPTTKKPKGCEKTTGLLTMDRCRGARGGYLDQEGNVHHCTSPSRRPRTRFDVSVQTQDRKHRRSVGRKSLLVCKG